MSECCSTTAPAPTPQAPTSSCCGGAPADTYSYRPQPFEVGEVRTLFSAVPVVATSLSPVDTMGALRVRLGIGRSDYRVRPGLYAVGEPDDLSDVIVTSNYKLTFDTVRRHLAGRSLWILVLDTRGVNVWCAAGKGTFGTDELVRRVQDVHLDQVVGHQRLIVPQLGATGVSAHEVRAATGWHIVWGPVQVSDLGAFLDAGRTATPEMRRVDFPAVERAKVAGVELSLLWRPRTLVGIVCIVALMLALALWAPTFVVPIAAAAGAALLAFLGGALLMPLVLPWIPFRTFSAKGAVAGGVLLLGCAALGFGGLGLPLYAWGLLLAGTAMASFTAMNFTGSSTFTSPSGVEWEMRRAMPPQIAAAAVGVILFVAGLFVL